MNADVLYQKVMAAINRGSNVEIRKGSDGLNDTPFWAGRSSEFDRPSVKYIGKDATVAVNPETNKAITVWKTSTRIRERLTEDV